MKALLPPPYLLKAIWIRITRWLMVNDSSFDLHYNLIYCCLINLVFFGLLSPDFFFKKKKGKERLKSVIKSNLS